MKPKTQTLNEQQEAQAAKEIGVFRYPIYAASAILSDVEKQARRDKTLINFAYVEAERWVDARSFALRLFGVAEVSLVRKSSKLLRKHFKHAGRWQIRWEGHSGFVSMQARFMTGMESEGSADPWLDVREVT